MTTAVDTNIFLSVITGDETERANAKRAILQASAEGLLVTSVICFAEMARHFADEHELDTFLAQLECAVIPLDTSTVFLAGKFFLQHLRRGGHRSRILADFLIAASALLYADRLLTNDRRFFGLNFPDLKAIGPDYPSKG